MAVGGAVVGLGEGAAARVALLVPDAVAARSKEAFCGWAWEGEGDGT